MRANENSLRHVILTLTLSGAKRSGGISSTRSFGVCAPQDDVPGALVVHAGFAVVQVLVVDDDPSIRRLIMAALKRDGYDFLEATNGREALDLMRSQHPNLVVLDLMMPVVSGWNVLQERLSDPILSKIPVIIVSANREPELVHAIDKGIYAFLPKPFDIAALTALVRACVAPE